MKVGFVFTNYNNSNYSFDLVSSISRNSSYPSSLIVIVDNNSNSRDKDELNDILKSFPEVVIIFNSENVGYFRGLNIGLIHLRENYPDIQHVVVGNNDLVFPVDFIDKIVNNQGLFEVHPVVSPDLITLDGVHQNPHVIHGISKFRNFVYDLYYTNYFFSILVLLFVRFFKPIVERRDYYSHDKAQYISAGYGACYILGPLFFERFQLLWAPTFLMGEELFLSKQLEDQGMKVYYDPLFKVDHHDHATMGKLPSKTLWRISRDSHLIYKKFR